VIVTKQVLQISDYFKNFNCIVETVKENRSLTKQSENGNHFNLDTVVTAFVSTTFTFVNIVNISTEINYT
jgi:hypothetical protein